jgi:hypothetical protein
LQNTLGDSRRDEQLVLLASYYQGLIEEILGDDVDDSLITTRHSAFLAKLKHFITSSANSSRGRQRGPYWSSYVDAFHSFLGLVRQLVVERNGSKLARFLLPMAFGQFLSLRKAGFEALGRCGEPATQFLATHWVGDFGSTADDLAFRWLKASDPFGDATLLDETTRWLKSDD